MVVFKSCVRVEAAKETLTNVSGYRIVLSQLCLLITELSPTCVSAFVAYGTCKLS